jgi:competence protein ComEC
VPRLRGASLTHGWRWLRATAIAEGERWTLWLPVALGAGVALYFALPIEPPPSLAWPFLVAAILISLAAAGSDTMAGRVSLGLIAALAIGFSTAQLRTAHVAAPVLLHRVGPVVIDGRVESTALHGKGVRLVLAPQTIGHMQPDIRPEKVRVSIRSGAEMLRPGDTIEVRAVLMPPPAPATPGDYDFGRAAYYLQIGAVGYSFGKPTVIAPWQPRGLMERAAQKLLLLRWRMTEHIHAVLPGAQAGSLPR